MESEIEALIKQIQDDDRVKDHPLKPMLLEDLENAKALCHRGFITQHETVEMAQHSAFLGISKGLRSQTSQVPYQHAPRRGRSRGVGAGIALTRQMAVNSLHNPDDDEIGAPPPPPAPQASPMTSPFANRMQVQLASVMRTMSSQAEDQDTQ